MTYDSLVNHGDYLSAHYLAEVLPKDLKARDGLLARWAAAEEAERRRHQDAVEDAKRLGEDPATVPPRVRTPREGLRALHGPYFANRAALQQDAPSAVDPDAPAPADWAKRLTDLHLATLRALGFTQAHEQTVTVHRSGREYPVQVLHHEPGLVTAVSCGWATTPDAALDPDGPGRLLHPVRLEASALITDGKALTDFLLECDDPPRYVLLLVGGVIVLADRMAWHEGRYLAVSLDIALDRRDDRNGGELDTIAALFGADSMRPPTEGGTAPLADFVDKSGKHAVGVSTELREGLRQSVEWIANEVLARLREQGVTPEQLDDPARLAKRLGRESLRYLYRILFLLYAEAQPTLGILPSAYPEYNQGYGLQRLGDLVVRDLVGERSRRGFHLYESLDLLFRMVQQGHRRRGSEPEDQAAEAADREATEAEKEAARLLAEGAVTQREHDERLREAARLRRDAELSADVGLRFEPLHSELFKDGSVQLIGRYRNLDTRLRNETLHRVLRSLMLTKGKGKERGGFISYAQLGINQLGAVYEGLMSYTGFIAEEDLYEVAKGGDPSGGSWMIPASKVQNYPDDVFVQREDKETGVLRRASYPRGTFVYRLAGRDRQTSASYYTPRSLTQVTVELALKHRLKDDTTARELLSWKVCEPALGSGAFLNEAIDQLAEKYLHLREREVGRRVDAEQRLAELQKVKAYIALHNAYGVDLNATAVELAEVSLWLNTMHPGMQAPWFGLHLRRGNSLIGASRKVYAAEDLPDGAWLAKKDPLPPRDLPFRDGELPEGAVHQFLLPAPGWGAVAAEPEAKRLAEAEATALARWRKGVQKAPKKKTDLRRLQGFARRAEFLWSLVAKRLELSERKIARRIEVWEADWLKDQPVEATDRQQVLDDLTATGTPYWRLKTVMDTWCALWFWPLDEVGLLDGTDYVYETGGALVGEGDLPRLGVPVPVPVAGEPEGSDVGVSAPEPSDGPAPGDLAWEAAGLFDDPDGEQGALAVDDPEAGLDAGHRGGGTKGRRSRIQGDRWRPCIPLKTLDDWLDFLECLLGTQDIPENTFLAGLDKLPLDEALDALGAFERHLDTQMGMDSAGRIPFRFPWLATVADIAGPTEKDIQADDGQGFFHWELHFAHIFQGERGGFDLQVGNPPWVRPRWEENQLLAEYEPWFMLTEKPAKAERTRRRDELLASEKVRAYLKDELATLSGTAAMLSSEVTYPLLTGTQPDLYRAFMCRAWEHTGKDGTVGLVHPDSHFSGDKEGRLREAAYERLRVHGDFANASNRFFPPPVGHASHFGVHVYGEAGEIGFDHLSWLFSVDALRGSYEDDGTAPDPGVKYGRSWDERPHKKRIVRVDEETLALWQRLTGDEDQPVRQARLLSPVSTAEAEAIKALADYPVRLGDEPQITSGYHESGAKAADLIEYNHPDEDGRVFQPTDWSEVILKGPQLGLANPMFKQPSQGGGEVLGLNPLTLADDAVPETEYVYVDKGEQDRWIDYRVLAQLRASENEVAKARAAVAERRLVPLEKVSEREVEEYLEEKARRPYTDFYRVAWRKMIAPDTERSLYVALLPPGPAHIDAIRSGAFRDSRSTALTVGFWSSIPVDYLLRTSKVRNLDVAPARRLPAPAEDHPLASALLLRTLRLNCLTSAYADLWEELYEPVWTSEGWACDWPGLSPLHEVTPTWNRSTPLRTECARRAALVEIDALAAVLLGVSADALTAMYQSRFPIMQDFDADTWFDANERKIAGSRHTYGFGQTKEDYEHLLVFNNGDRSEPPEGYTAPFYKADREAEMRAAHAHFTALLKKAG
ncbi:Eco57I restriction-modification methylase domain-containing protein [Streptomyces sp. NPDC001848]|uniref:Eco57I restriction-modification methylase domain-containing protein n=1 Tax=Streptomyces sp. NPDC001848 TaxID=3364618 RepID=UPI0036A66428